MRADCATFIPSSRTASRRVPQRNEWRSPASPGPSLRLQLCGYGLKLKARAVLAPDYAQLSAVGAPLAAVPLQLPHAAVATLAPPALHDEERASPHRAKEVKARHIRIAHDADPSARRLYTKPPTGDPTPTPRPPQGDPTPTPPLPLPLGHRYPLPLGHPYPYPYPYP